MYAKKPREPGTEPAKPARRRSRKKEVITNQYVVQEMVHQDGPRINIIRYDTTKTDFPALNIFVQLDQQKFI